jgi:hypothetical protein
MSSTSNPRRRSPAAPGRNGSRSRMSTATRTPISSPPTTARTTCQ